MNYKIILKIIGLLLIFIGLSMGLSVAWSVFFNDGQVRTFLYSIGATLAIGGVMYLYGGFKQSSETSNYNVTIKESFLIVAGGWFAVSLLSALPFYLSGHFGGFANAFFESVSGFTTTGASILTSIENVPKSLLFWRSFTHFLGGMGFIVLAVAILPLLGIGGLQLYKQEVPGVTQDKLTPRVQSTARYLWLIYIGLVAIQTVILTIEGMSFFDALNHSFATIATGGFSTKNSSVAGFNSPVIDYTIVLFMFLAGVNFSLHYAVIKYRSIKKFFESEEFNTYVYIVLAATTILVLYTTPELGFVDSLRYSLFQVVSIITTTGFATYNYLLWPVATHVIIVFLMIIGGMGGSTGGGLKVSRVIIVFKQIGAAVKKILNPDKVSLIYFEKKVLKDDILLRVLGFFGAYIVLLGLTFIISMYGIDFTTSFTAVMSCLSNIGPGLGKVGPVENFNFIPDSAKWILSVAMIMGRLEIFTIIVLFTPSYWLKKG